MVKKRVHEIAKELNIESKEIINKLSAMGINIKSHMSTLEDSEVERLLQYFQISNPHAEKSAPVKAALSVPQEQKTENKTDPSAVEIKKSQRIKGQLAGHRKGGKSPEADYSSGSGLVDWVPSRPPDRRFEEKPKQGENPPPSKTVGGQARSEQGGKPKEAGEHQERQIPVRSQQSKPQQVRLPDDKIRESRYQQGRTQQEISPQDRGRQDRPQHVKPQQGRPAQAADGSLQRYERTDKGSGRSVEQRQPGTSRPGGQQGQRPGIQQGARPKKLDRHPYEGSGQGVRVKPDLTVMKPQGRFDDREHIFEEKAKSLDKQKQQARSGAGRPVNKSRYDKRAAAADIAEERLRARMSAGGARKKGTAKTRERQQNGQIQPVEKKPIVIGESITVQELALKMHKSPAELIKKLMQLGVLATINQDIDCDTATLLAVEFGYEVEVKLPVDMEALLMQEPEDDPGLLVQRPCIVTVMGHVDHGKTSLLDAIRQTNVTATEAGGITQHIGAYQVEHGGKKITFVDTPGHEAFTAMRARGAQVTDIAVLVVAADDGVMPQTVEAINHSREAGVPIIVAINKMDKPGANPERVKQELTEYGLIAEEWGGDTICVNVSALKREGIKDLLEMILLVAEMKELKANPERLARGTVIEAELDKGRGPVATVLVQNGTLKIGDTIIAGSVFGRVRAMIDDKGHRIKKAGPSTPVEVLGFSETPMAGDIFVVVEDEKLARSIVSRRQIRKREEELKVNTRISLDDLFKRIQEGQIKELSIIIKADVQGSVEALRQALERLSTEEVKVNIIHGGVGAITETDIMLASASNAIVLGFNVRPDVNARKAAESEKVDVRLYRVIYEAIEDVKSAMSGLLEPEYKEVNLGRAEIRKIFRASKIGTIAGCYVLEGKIERDASIRLVRGGIVIHEGKLNSLKRFKDDVKEVLQGYECGLAIEKFNEIQEGDIIEAFTVEAIKRELS